VFDWYEKRPTSLPPPVSPTESSLRSSCRKYVFGHRDILKVLKVKIQISSLIRQLEDASIDNSVRTIAVELRVCGLQGGFWTIADGLLAPEILQPIKAPKSSTSSNFTSWRSFLSAETFSANQNLELSGKERPRFGTVLERHTSDFCGINTRSIREAHPCFLLTSATTFCVSGSLSSSFASDSTLPPAFQFPKTASSVNGTVKAQSEKPSVV
jgi:hypothetical protein